MADVFTDEIMPYQAALVSFACRLGNQKADAQDLAQDTLLAAYTSLHTYTPGTNARAWLFRILVNLNSKKQAKTGKRKEIDFESFNEDEAIHYLQPSVDELAARQALDPRIIEALAKLPEAWREMTYLATVEDLSNQEIADRLNKPLGTVMSSLFRAKKRLAIDLADMRGEDRYASC